MVHGIKNLPSTCSEYAMSPFSTLARLAATHAAAPRLPISPSGLSFLAPGTAWLPLGVLSPSPFLCLLVSGGGTDVRTVKSSRRIDHSRNDR